MFGASESPNPLEAFVLKATDESFTSDHWEHIMDVCDKVNDDPDNGAANAAKSVRKRLNTVNANVLLRSLTLILSLAENCGSKMKQELTTSEFTDALYKLATHKSIHYSVKDKLVEVMKQMVESFKNDPSLRNMEKTLAKIQNDCPSMPQVPKKSKISDDELRKQEEEFQKALKLSMEEFNMSSSAATKDNQLPAADSNPFSSGTSPVWQQEKRKPQASEPEPEPMPEPEPEVLSNDKHSPLTVSKVVALYDLTGRDQEELSFKRGDIITVLDRAHTEWWRGSLKGKVGIFPINYVKPVKEPTREEMIKEVETEYSINKQAVNIEKLLNKLQILNNCDDPAEVLSASNDEVIRDLYNNITPLRIQVAKLIDTHSRKKEELLTLDAKLTDAEKKYNTLMESVLMKYRQSMYNSPMANQYYGYGQMGPQMGQPMGQPMGQQIGQPMGPQMGQPMGQPGGQPGGEQGRQQGNQQIPTHITGAHTGHMSHLPQSSIPITNTGSRPQSHLGYSGYGMPSSSNYNPGTQPQQPEMRIPQQRPSHTQPQASQAGTYTGSPDANAGNTAYKPVEPEATGAGFGNSSGQNGNLTASKPAPPYPTGASLPDFANLSISNLPSMPTAGPGPNRLSVPQNPTIQQSPTGAPTSGSFPGSAPFPSNSSKFLPKPKNS